MSNFQQASTKQRDVGQPRFNWQTTQLIWLLLGLLEALFAMRFLLRLIGATGADAFSGLVYALTSIFLLPYAGLAAGNPAGSGLVLEISTLMAMAVYGLLGWLLARATWIIFYRPYANLAATPASVIEQTRR